MNLDKEDDASKPILQKLYHKWLRSIIPSSLNMLTIPFVFAGSSAFSRYLERRADRGAVRKLNAAEGGIAFLQSYYSQDNSVTGFKWLRKKIADLYSSHPSPEERIAYLRNQHDKQQLLEA